VINGRAMGTSYTLKFKPLPAGVNSSTIEKIAHDVFARHESAVSSYRADSEVMRFNASRSIDWFPVSPTTARIADEALRVAESTRGALDPTVDPLVRLWGFGPARRGEHALPAEQAIAETRARVDYKKLRVRLDPPALKKAQPDISIDLSALTCGCALDELAGRLDALRVTDYLLELGGALRASGTSNRGRAWRVGVELPAGAAPQLACIVSLANTSISTSGSYRQFFEIGGRRYSHIIDPRTGWPVADRLVSVTVVAATCAEADAMDTALMVLGPDAGYALAVQRGMAALFLIRGERGFIQKSTPRFDALRIDPGSSAPGSSRDAAAWKRGDESTAD
jgi:thiamine biosynthesis lipoprotein